MFISQLDFDFDQLVTMILSKSKSRKNFAPHFDSSLVLSSKQAFESSHFIKLMIIVMINFHNVLIHHQSEHCVCFFFAASSIIYTQSFTSGSTSSSQCTAWTTFISLLTTGSYTSMTMSGSNDPTGITLTNPTYILGIATALRTSSAYGPVSSNGYSWAVGICGSYYELTATGTIYQCNTGYTVRPCIGNLNWGAINGYTCSASSQTMTVIFT
jgi:hypothetical protein